MKQHLITLGFRRWSAGFFGIATLLAGSRLLPAHAQSSYTWNGGSGTTGNWSDGANWGGSGPANPQAFLNFNGAARTTSTNDFSGGGPGYQIYFKNGASAFNLFGNSIFFYDFGGADPNIQNEGTSPTQTINFPVANGNNNGVFHVLNLNVNTGTSQGPLTFNGPVSSADANQPLRVVNIYGPSAITFNGVIADFDSTHQLAISQLGSGSTTLRATNTFTGDTTVNAGTLVLATNSALANGGNFIRLGDTAGTAGANLNLNGGNNLSTAINVRSGSTGGKIIASTAGTTGNATYGGSLFLDADVTVFANANSGVTLSGSTLDLKNQTLTIDGTGSNVISGSLQNSTGAGKLVKNNTGPLYLSSAGSYTGGTTINAGIVQVNSNGAFGTGNVTVNNSASQTKILLNGVIITNNLTLNVTNAGAAQGVIQEVDNTSSTNSGIVIFNTNTITGGSLYGPTTSGLLTMAGAINVVSPGTLLLVRDGRVRFSGGGSYTNLDIRSSTSSLGANNGLATTAVVDIGGNGSPTVATLLDLNGFSQTLAGVKNSVTPANIAWVTNSASATPSVLTFSNSSVQVFNGSIVGNLAVNVVNGTQIYSNSPVAGNGIFGYTGDTTITNGSLKLAAASLLPNGTGKGNLIVTNAGTLDLNTFNQTVNGLSGNGTVDSVAGGTPTLTVGSNNASSTFSGYLKNTAGTLALTKFGSGTLTLNGTNTYSGSTTVATGSTIQFQSSAAMSTNSTLVIQNTAVVQLRADANTIFTNGTLNPAGAANITFDVNQLTGAGANNVLTLATTNVGFAVGGNGTMTFNVTGGNGDSLTITPNASFTSNAGNGFTLVPTTANVTFAGNITGASGNGSQVLTLDGTSANNFIGGVIGGAFAGSPGLNKQNTSSWILSGANTFSGDTRVIGGTLQLNNALALQNSSVNLTNIDSGTLNLNNLNATLGGLKGSRNLALGTGTVSIGNNSAANTYSGSLSGSALVKVGAGAWTLNGTNTFAGTTAISAGELIGQTGSSLSNSTVTVASGATNGVLLAAANGQWVCGGLTYNAGTTYADFNFNGIPPSTTAAPILVNGNLGLTVTPNVIVRSGGVTIAPGTYPLIKYTGTLSGTPPATALSLPAGITATIVNNTTNKSIDLNVTVGNAVNWAVGNGTWDINTTANWKSTSGSAVNYLDGEPVVLDDTASGASPIIISMGVTVTPASITANLTNKSYTLSPSAPGGVFTGNAPLVKNGTGTLTISTTNTAYAGTISLNGGTLALGGGSSIGSGQMTMNNGTTLSLPNSGASVTVGNPIFIPVGATATFSTTALGNGIAGTVVSGDSTSVISINGSVSFSATTRQLDPFTGTVLIPSGQTLRFSSTSGGDGSTNANFVVNGTLQPRNANITTILGSLSGSGVLSGPQTVTTSTSPVTYIIGTNNASTTFSGRFTELNLPTGAATTNDPTTIVKVGTGTLTLSGISTNAGTTTVAVGALMGVTGGAISNSAVTVASGATNGVNVTIPGSQFVIANLTYAAGTETAVFAFGVNTPSTSVAPLQVQNSVAINGILNVLITGGSTTIPVGTYPLIKYTGTQTGFATTNPVSLPLGIFGIITNDAANKQIALIVTNVLVPNLLWTAGTGNWDATSINWTNILGGGLTNWLDNYLAQFDDTASGAGPFTVTLATNVNPVGVLFTNSTKDYTLAGGTITGSGTLTKSGSGKLTLLTTNAATGGIAVSGGTLQGNHATLVGTIANSAAIVFDQSINGSNNAVISGAGTLTKQNSGTLALGGNNTYTGKTFVNAGTLAISAGVNVGGNPGSATPDQITINGATLLATNGATTITLPTNAGLTITNTATIDVGAGITLDYPAQAISGGGSLVKNGAGTFQIDEGTVSSSYTNLTLNAGTIAFNKSSGGLGAGSLVINGGVLRTTTASPRLPNNSSVLVNGDFTLGSSTTAAITFSGGGAWTLGNGTRTITVDTITATITGNVGDGGNNYGLTKSGSGVLTLNGVGSWTGATLINAGALKLGNNLGAGNTAITAAGTLQIANGITVSNSFTATQTFESLDVPDASAIGTYIGTATAVGGSANFRFMASGAGATLVFSNATVNTGSKNFWPTRGTIVYAGSSAMSSSVASLIGRSAGNPASLTLKDTATGNFSGGFRLGDSGGINSSLSLTLQDSASLNTSTSGFDFLGTTVASSLVSLNGGTLAVGAFFKTAANAETLSLNGGNITANASSASFFPSLAGLTANISTGGALINDNGFNITIAQPLLHDAALGATADGGLIKSGVGVTTSSGVNTYSGPTAVNGGTLLVSGVTGTNIVTVNTNATLSGTGTLNGATTVALGGTVQSGSGGGNIATLTISNSLTLAGNAKFNLNRTNAQNANLIAGLTSVNYGGTLTVTNLGDALQSGDTFTLFAAGSYSGSFVNIILPPLTGVLVWNTNNLAVNGTISVILGISPTTLVLTSSANPSGYLDPLTFTATLAPTNATGLVTFYKGATPFSTNALTLGVATSGSISSLARGTNNITATYLGDVNYSGSTNSLAQIVTNHPPVTPMVNYLRIAGVNTLRITIADLLTNVTDLDSDTVLLTSASTSTNGISLLNSSGFLLYQTTNNLNDQFNYTVSDGNGGTNTGSVNIVVQPFVTGQNATVTVSGSTAKVSFNGIPGYTYGVQRSTNLTAWATIVTTNAPANGAFEWTDDFSDLGVVPGSAYYRLQWNP